MKAIIGLGNPGCEYEGTRHNVGFELVDLLSQSRQIPLSQKGFRAVYGRGNIEGETLLLVKPQTFMNLSGETVGQIVEKEGIAPADILVICDDIHLEVGRLRLRGQGSSGGQNGLKSVAAHLATQAFPRLRIGVGEPPPSQQVEWVLGRFNRTDRQTIDEALITGIGAVEVWLTQGLQAAMNRFNIAPAPPV